MSRYGISYYGIDYYGTDNPIKFDATPFTAKPAGHNQILLNWTDPTGNWSKLTIVRNNYGYPVNVWDGQQILTAYNGTDPVFYLDSYGLVSGRYYYYSIFVYSLTQYTWVNAGNAFALSVKDLGNTEKMYSYLPSIYKITQPYQTTTDTWDNPDLYSFLSNFGFELDYTQNMTDLLINRYDPQTVNGTLVPVLMNQFGLTYEPALGLQQNRKLLRDGVTLTKQKGSKEGLVGFIKDFTNWGVPVPISGTPNPSTNGIVVGHNLMLDYNDSSFEEGVGHWQSSDGTADIDRLSTYNIQSISVTSSVATVIIGAHNYDVGNYIVIQGLPYPLFNSTTPVVLTAVDQNNSVSFSTTSADFATVTGYNPTTGVYGTLSPYPAPWVESTAPTLFPNKAKSIMALYNSSASTQTISAYCGDDDAINKGIPVTAANTYTYSVYAAKGAGSTARNVTTTIKWFNRFGVYLSSSSGTAVSNNTAQFSGAIRPYVTATAPANAYYACPGISVASVGGAATNEHHYFDAAQFEQASSATAFDEARQLHITLRANRINELINPHFASPVTPWTATGASSTVISQFIEPNVETFSVVTASISSNVATVTLNLPHSYQVGQSIYISGVTGTGASNYNGTRTITAVTLNTFTYSVTASNSTVTTGAVVRSGNGLQLTATATGTAVVISWDGSTTSQLMGIYYPNTSYTFSIYVQAQTSSESFTPKISWYDSSYTFISTTSGTSFNANSLVWTRPYITATAPATAAYAAVELDWTTAATGDVVIYDEALFENTGQVLDYFDGFNGSGTSYDLFWEGGQGNANAARSHYYKNRFAVQTRLYGATLNAQLPMGSTAAIYLAQPQT